MTNWLDASISATALAKVAWAEPLKPSSLLFDRADIDRARARARELPGFLDQINEGAAGLLVQPPEEIRPPLATTPALEAVRAAEAWRLLGRDEIAVWAKQRIFALLKEPTWMFREHSNPHCDHVMANVGAAIAYAQDLLEFSDDERARAAEAMRSRLLLPFLEGTRERTEFWAKKEIATNWKIMTCGDAGLAICAFSDCWAQEAPEALALAARGVMETLEAVPAEGDWSEGATYWFGTLFLGLRFILALRRRTQGSADLSLHPVLKITGDFASHMVTPGGRLYAWNDNWPEFESPAPNSCALECLYLLAFLTGRADWRFTARKFSKQSLFRLVFDDPGAPTEPPQQSGTKWFPSSGVLTMRSGWKSDDAFVGLRCGRTMIHGHGHLDAGSFVVEAAGAPLLTDPGCWKYGPGFFDLRKRWDYDANATIGHNTLLIGGRGQLVDDQKHPRLLRQEHAGEHHLVEMELTECYSDRALCIRRFFVFLEPDFLIIRDWIVLREACHVEWLAHYGGTLRDDGLDSVIENQKGALRIRTLRPEREGWRINDVIRRTFYTDYDYDKAQQPAIRYRSFGPIHAAEQFDLVFAIRLGCQSSESWPKITGQDGRWELQLGRPNLTLRADAEQLALSQSP